MKLKNSNLEEINNKYYNIQNKNYFDNVYSNLQENFNKIKNINVYKEISVFSNIIDNITENLESLYLDLYNLEEKDRITFDDDWEHVLEIANNMIDENKEQWYILDVLLYKTCMLTLYCGKIEILINNSKINSTNIKSKKELETFNQSMNAYFSDMQTKMIKSLEPYFN